jgi:hypothetical protein
MSLIEIVTDPTGQAWCVEGYAANSMGGRLVHHERTPGRWTIDVVKWPILSGRTVGESYGAANEDEAIVRVREVAERIASGELRPSP